MTLFGMLKLTSTIFLSFHHFMKPISSPQHSSVISLQEGFSICQIQSKTSLGESIVGRIKKEVDSSDKENNKGGHPSKLSPHDNQAIFEVFTLSLVFWTDSRHQHFQA